MGLALMELTLTGFQTKFVYCAKLMTSFLDQNLFSNRLNILQFWNIDRLKKYLRTNIETPSLLKSVKNETS